MALNEERGFRPMPPSSTQGGPTSPLAQMEHLLRVVASISHDAQDAWADIFAQVKPHSGRGGGSPPPALEGSPAPACGWQEFIERLWLLKHYIDSIGRICNQQCPSHRQTAHQDNDRRKENA